MFAAGRSILVAFHEVVTKSCSGCSLLHVMSCCDDDDDDDMIGCLLLVVVFLF